MFGLGRRRSKRRKEDEAFEAGLAHEGPPAAPRPESGSRSPSPVPRRAAEPEDEPETGPFDEQDAPDDDLARLDLGSVRVPVPDGVQLQVEVDPEGPVRAVHLVTPVARLTVSAFAAPRTGGLWREVSKELSDQLQADGARVDLVRGQWGLELSASSPEVALRFVGVDGPRWLLRGVAAGPTDQAEAAAEALREIIKQTVVVRGQQPMPVRTPLPLELPEAIAQHLAEAQAQQGQ